MKANENEIQLHFFKNMVLDEDLKLLTDELKVFDVETVFHDKKQVFNFNIFDEIVLFSCIVLSESFLLNLINGVISNGAWDTIKYFMIDIFKKSKLKDKWFWKQGGGKVQMIKPKIGFDIKKNDKSFLYGLNLEIPEELFLQSLDMILNHQKELINQEKSQFFVYDHIEKQWKKGKFENEIVEEKFTDEEE